MLLLEDRQDSDWIFLRVFDFSLLCSFFVAMQFIGLLDIERDELPFAAVLTLLCFVL